MSRSSATATRTRRWAAGCTASWRAIACPKRLAGTEGEDGEVPARLTPIFRDRDELPAAGDLSERVRAALAVSRNLIVVCSPHSAASPWVAKEIATFRELHPDRPIFTAIVEGEPDQCFSPALLEGGAEPLAADLRKEGDGRRLGPAQARRRASPASASTPSSSATPQGECAA